MKNLWSKLYFRTKNPEKVMRIIQINGSKSNFFRLTVLVGIGNKIDLFLIVFGPKIWL